MNVRRFTAVKRNKEEAIGAYPQDRRHVNGFYPKPCIPFKPLLLPPGSDAKHRRGNEGRIDKHKASLTLPMFYHFENLGNVEVFTFPGRCAVRRLEKQERQDSCGSSVVILGGSDIVSGHF
jgi:hypothetical protein